MSQFNQVHATKKYRLGTRKEDVSGNQYVYLKGVASCAAGDFVAFVGSAFTAVRSLDSTITSGALAVAQAAVDAATKYGWFMTRGYYATANVATHSGGSGLALFLSSSAGRATSTPATEKTIVGGFTTGNSTANVGPVFVSNPVAPGDIST